MSSSGSQRDFVPRRPCALSTFVPKLHVYSLPVGRAPPAAQQSFIAELLVINEWRRLAQSQVN